ncbi:MAG TPA: EAL domain-containing protein [Mycobacteriales bacterium]|nr:EAL domain-containing protein [Mycobacteriales bacterium]
MSLSDSMDTMRANRALIEALIEHPERLGPDFQPIRILADDTLVGYKATGRGQEGTELGSTLALLESAQGLGLVERLDWAFRCLAFDAVLDKGVDVELFITPEPETYGGVCPPRLAASFGRGKRGVKVAAEVPSHAFADPAAMLAGVEEYRGWGWRVVADDVADVPGAVEVLDRLRPDVVKLDLALPGRNAATPGDGVRRMLDWAQGAGATVMALSVDTETARAAAQQLGATTGRGRLLGPPGSLPA